MRKQSFFACIGLLVSATLSAQSFTWQPVQPKPGEKITVTYDPSGTVLASAKNIEAVVYSFNNTNTTAEDLALTKSGNKYKASFMADTGARVMAIGFQSGKQKDPNGKDGYLIAAYRNGKEVTGAQLAYSMLYDFYGKYLFDMEEQPERALAAIEKEWTSHPENADKNMGTYISLLSRVKKKEAQPEILAILEKRMAEPVISEGAYGLAINWFGRLKLKEKADQLTAAMKQQFPDGNWKKSEATAAINKAKDPADKETAYRALLTAYPPVTEQEKSAMHYYLSSVASAYALNKDKRDLTKFKELTKALSISEKASLYNNVSWELAQKDAELAFSEAISKEATLWAKAEISKPKGKKPDMTPASKWTENRKMTYGMYADTYAYILYKEKKYGEGIIYAREAMQIQEGKNADYNDRYALLLEKTAPAEQVQKELEKMVKEGYAGKETNAVLRRVLVKTLSSEEKATERMASLSQASKEKAQEELVKSMLKEDAPGFTLKDKTGAVVSLASLKGKVVILDFWATWCGPCKASFPGMQKAVDKYKQNDKVVFLFIDTWESQETQEQRKKEVEAFIKENKYSFHVLYDDKQKDDPDQFEVVSKYKVEGIPTKFVIGKDGNIRFKSVGFSGSDDKLVEEISAMIDMAGK